MIRMGFGQRRVTSPRKEVIEPFETRETQARVRREGGSGWSEITGIARNSPDTNRIVHTVNVAGLEPDSPYEFQLPNNRVGAVYLTWADDPCRTMVIHWHTFNPFPSLGFKGSYANETYKFRTMPLTLDDSIKIAHITDTHGGGWNQRIFDHIASFGDIRAMVHSGDMANGNGGESSPSSWYTLFNALSNTKNSDGTIIPIIPALGNHEVWGGSAGYHWSDGNVGIKPNFDTHSRGDAEWYYVFFPSFLEQGYALHQLGDYLDLWQLDPGITTRIDDGQDVWLGETLGDSTAPHQIISLHYSPYTAGPRPWDTRYLKGVRDTLCPIWEPYQPLVLVGHEHVWSKTVPIKDGAEHPDGTVYIGSGPAGHQVKAGQNPNAKWWLERSRSSEFRRFDFEEVVGSPDYREPHETDGATFTVEEVNNWWLIELRYDKRIMTAFDMNEDVIHTFEQLT